MPEFKWLYRTWIETQKGEPKKWRTDLIIFIENNSTFFKSKNAQFFDELDCKFENKRTSKSDRPMCTLINYVALNKRKFPKLKQKIFNNLGVKQAKVIYFFIFLN